MLTARPRAVLLDAGGTLFAEHPSRAALYAQAARQRGLEVTDEAMARAMSEVHDALPRQVEGQFRYSRGWFEVFIQEVFARFGFRGDLDELTRHLFVVFEDPRNFRVFPDVRPTLTRLKGAGIALGVVSNWSPSLVRVLGRLGFASDFRVVVVSAVCRLEKPDPAIFRRAADELGVAPEECIHVGDRPENDADAANAAGMRGVLLDRRGSYCGHPDRVESLVAVLTLAGLPTSGL